MNTKAIDSAYAGSVYTVPLHRKVVSWLIDSSWWLASATLGLFILKAPQVWEFVKGVLS